MVFGVFFGVIGRGGFFVSIFFFGSFRGSGGGFGGGFFVSSFGSYCEDLRVCVGKKR